MMSSSKNTDLVEIRGLKSSQGYFKEKEFLSVEEIYEHLQRRSSNHKSGEKMKSRIWHLRSGMFLRLPVEFPVTGLQHSTPKDSMKDILSSQSFIGNTSRPDRREFENLSFWAPDISSTYIEGAREKTYLYVQEHCPDQAEEYRGNIMQQFANSPAFSKSASHYGNFTFSLPFSDLLSLYGDQFCNKKKPQLSILGTNIYKLEIVHYVVVHSPDEDRFKDLPRVPILDTREEPLPCVYWMGDTLYWRPQSTSRTLKVLTQDGQIRKCDERVVDGRRYNEDLCVWNLLTFAFHIPRGRALRIPVQTLTDNLSACEALEPYMKNSRTTKPIAEICIKDMKKRYGDPKDSNQMK